MKKILLSVMMSAVTLCAWADEGMWLLPYLQKMNARDMKAKGCRISAADIYSADRSSLKDAIVIFGRGCTGEVVSPDGLLFTNHHCGYSSIQELSSVEHDYLKNGFWAGSSEEEIPAPGLEVRFVRSISDVTADILGNVPSTAGEKEREQIVKENIKALTEKMLAGNPGKEVWVRAFFGNNRYFAFVNEVYKDVRLVGTPPSSIGKFGGDTDNWMWPRHTGDFSVFRIYAGKDNRPAEYSPENVPYRADRYLKVSLDGYDEGDFAMVMGFPGSTSRFMTSYEIDNVLGVSNPNRIFIRGERQDILREDMAASDRVRIQYASKYASSSNYWKNSIGMSRGLERLGVKAQKQAQEEAFRKWADARTCVAGDADYRRALPLIEESMKELSDLNHNRQYISEAFLNAVEILTPARSLGSKSEIKEPEKSREALEGWYRDYNAPTDRKVAKRMLAIARENMTRLPSFYTEIVDKEFGGDTDAYVDYVFDNSVFTDEAATLALLDNFNEDTAARLAEDPAVILSKSVMELYRALNEERKAGMLKYNEGHRLYIAGLLEMYPDRAWAPDANFTIRLTYGNILPYSPADGIEYNYYTTLKGVMEKEDPENPTEFTVPERLKELYAARDFGRYADSRGQMPVAFLSNLDITGGNSGSPVLNSRGELIGLAFDGNWEAMSGDIAFEPELQRCIGVDVRYVLFIIDKFAGASWLLDEMEIVGGAK